jgi:DNA-binding transcriptional regulator YdaS (Cro superfamily)
MTLTEYLKGERGRVATVAAVAGLAPAFLSQMANGVRGVPAERAADIERACQGAVRRWDLRPDDWHRIWPELVGTEGAPPVDVPQEVA